MTRRHRGLPAAVCSVVLLVLPGCTRGLDDPVVVRSPSAPEVTTAADCAAVIRSDVVRDLGWTTTTTPTYDLGTCTLTSTDGTITVQRIPVAERGSRCGALRPDGGPAPAVDWLGPDVEACAAVSADGSGVQVLLALVRDDLLVEARVLPAGSSDVARVRRALVALVQSAAERL